MEGGGEGGTVPARLTGWGGGSKQNTEKERFSVGLKVQGRRDESEGGEFRTQNTVLEQQPSLRALVVTVEDSGAGT